MASITPGPSRTRGISVSSEALARGGGWQDCWVLVLGAKWMPLGTLPEGIENVASLLPMGPFTEVLRTGWLGGELGGPELTFAGSTADALPWLAALLAWLVIAAAVAKRYFRWEPRQS
jgi:ABC-2 type transport system permease protein